VIIVVDVEDNNEEKKEVIKMIRIGIADVWGIDSCFDRDKVDGQMLHYLKCRAFYNRHRHAVVYEAKLNKKTDDLVQAQIKKGNYIEALNVLKKDAMEIKAGEGFMKPWFKKSWKLIPNPDLDPWHA